MDRKQIIEMLKDLVSEIDYDIYKEMFVYDDTNDETNCEALISIVEKYLS